MNNLYLFCLDFHSSILVLRQHLRNCIYSKHLIYQFKKPKLFGDTYHRQKVLILLILTVSFLILQNIPLPLQFKA